GGAPPDLSQLEDVHLKPGDAFRITPGTVHYMEAVTDCEVLEVSTPDLDDVVRLKDRYGREGTNAP
ncbi:MAG TPA: cupin, partial [Gemmatimonadaceae bacterium]